MASTIPLIIAWTFFFTLGGREPIVYNFNWLVLRPRQGALRLPAGPHQSGDALIVATISWLVQVYSIGYMAGDPGIARYYAFLSLFAWPC